MRRPDNLHRVYEQLGTLNAQIAALTVTLADRGRVIDTTLDAHAARIDKLEDAHVAQTAVLERNRQERQDADKRTQKRITMLGAAVATIGLLGGVLRRAILHELGIE